MYTPPWYLPAAFGLRGAWLCMHSWRPIVALAKTSVSTIKATYVQTLSRLAWKEQRHA